MILVAWFLGVQVVWLYTIGCDDMEIFALFVAFESAILIFAPTIIKKPTWLVNFFTLHGFPF
jgi:hypothetical protein